MANSVPKSIKASLYIDGKPAEASLKNVEQVTRTLERELKGLTIGTEAWNAKMRQLSENKKYLQDIRQEMNGVSGAFGKMKAELGKVGMLAAGYLGFDFVTSQFQSLIAGNAKLSDSLADIRRVTGLTEAGVMDLDASLGRLDTRTSKGGLRDIAVIAGKLGVAKNDILGFVEATDKLVVALGDELGDADQITTQLGKILNVFEGEVTGDNITRLGNAMVGLANSGVASAGFIAQYTQMVSGIAETAGLSLPATLALGAGLEEMGGRAESSATATQNLLMSITSNKNAYKVAGVSLAEFNNLLGKAPEQALLKYSKGLAGNKDAFNEVTSALKENGEEGVRTIELITKLGQNYDFFNKKIEETKKLYQETGQINEAFALKNQTLGAQVEKLGKEFSSIAQSKTLVNFLSKVIVLTSELIGWIKRNSDMLSNFAKVITIGAGAWAGYRAAAMLAATWTTINAARMAIARSATLLFALAKAQLTGNTLRAAAAQRLLGIATMATPWGMILGLIAAVATAYVAYSGKVSNAVRIQQSFNDINAKAETSIVDEVDAINKANEALKKKNITKTEQIRLVNLIRSLTGDHLKGYTDEAIAAGKAEEAIRKYVSVLKAKALVEAAGEKIKELQKERIDVESRSVDESLTTGDKIIAAGLRIGGAGRLSEESKKRRAGNNKKAELGRIDAEMNAIENKYGDDLLKKAIDDANKDNGGGGGTGAGGGTGESAAETARKKALSEFERNGEAYKKLELQRLNDQLSSNEKELKQEEDKYNALIDAEKAFQKEKGVTAEQKRVSQERIDQLNVNKEKAMTDLRVRQEADMVVRINDLRVNLTNLHETELQKQLDQINKFYDEEERKFAGNSAALARLRKERLQETTNAETREKERLEQEKKDIEEKYETLGENTPEVRKAKINKKYDDEIEALKKKFSKELQMTRAFHDAVDLINKNRDKDLEQIRIEKLAANNNTLLEGTKIVADAAFNIMANNNRAQTDAKIRSLEDQRNAELANKNLTEQQREAINAKYNEKVKAEKVRAWRAEQRAAVAQAIINGAIAMTKVAAQTGILSFAFSPIVAIATAAQVATILAQKPPQFAKGGFSNSEPAGYVSNTTLFNKSASGRPFVAGEAGAEWIAPNWMVTSPRFANIIGALESARQDKRMFATGGYNGPSQSATASSSQPSGLEMMIGQLITEQREFVREQQRFNSLPIVNDYNKKEDYERKLEYYRNSQTA